MTDTQATVWLTDTPCPTCGEMMATDGREVWCVGACLAMRLVMAERGQLIAKKFGDGLSEEETARLAFLNEEANRLCPRVSADMLRSLESVVQKHETLAKEIDELLRTVPGHENAPNGGWDG